MTEEFSISHVLYLGCLWPLAVAQQIRHQGLIIHPMHLAQVVILQINFESSDTWSFSNNVGLYNPVSSPRERDGNH
jgi:hypothetical protein